MDIIRILLIFIEVVSSLLLIGIILIQQSKGGGLGTAFGGGAGDSLFGARAGNILTKITVTLGIVFMVNTLFLALVYAHRPDKSLMATAAPLSAPAAPGPAAAPAQPQVAPAPQGAPTLPSVELDGNANVAPTAAE